MSSSEKRIAASQKNGALGGVKTLEGKQASSKNAVRHGILAFCTTKFDWISGREIFDSYCTEFEPQTASEIALVESLALTHLRLSRCARMETDLLVEALDPPKFEPLFAGLEEREISKGSPAPVTLEKLEKFEIIYTRYEPRLMNRFLKLLAMLNAIKKGRLGSFGQKDNPEQHNVA